MFDPPKLGKVDLLIIFWHNFYTNQHEQTCPIHRHPQNCPIPLRIALKKLILSRVVLYYSRNVTGPPWDWQCIVTPHHEALKESGRIGAGDPGLAWRKKRIFVSHGDWPFDFRAGRGQSTKRTRKGKWRPTDHPSNRKSVRRQSVQSQ